MQTALIWIAVYLCTGVLALLVARIAVVAYKGESWSWEKLREDVSGDDRQMIPLVLAIWPLIPLVPVIGWLVSKVGVIHNGDSPHQFHCQRSNLVRRVNVSEAEAGSVVTEPLGRAPVVPFGHLHAGWRAFIAKGKPGWHLWQFEVPGYLPPPDRSSGPLWSVPRGRKVGYAWTRRWKRVEAEFISEWD